MLSLRSPSVMSEAALPNRWENCAASSPPPDASFHLTTLFPTPFFSPPGGGGSPRLSQGASWRPATRPPASTPATLGGGAWLLVAFRAPREVSVQGFGWLRTAL